MIYAVEGPNYVGKSTLCAALARSLSLRSYADPGRGGALSGILSGGTFTAREWALLGAQNALDVAAFAADRDFVVDRWILTNLAYDARRGEVSWPVDLLVHLTSSVPHVVLLLDADPDVILARSRGDRDAESVERVEELRALYALAADRFVSAGGFVVTVDASGSPGEVLSAARRAISWRIK